MVNYHEDSVASSSASLCAQSIVVWYDAIWWLCNPIWAPSHNIHQLVYHVYIRVTIFVQTPYATQVVADTWWRHQMETFSALLAICEENHPMDSPHKGHWRGALMFFFYLPPNKRPRRHRAHYADTVVSAESINEYNIVAKIATSLSHWLSPCHTLPRSHGVGTAIWNFSERRGIARKY